MKETSDGRTLASFYEGFLYLNRLFKGYLKNRLHKNRFFTNIKYTAIAGIQGSFQSGQMGQTVNLLAQPSKVQILHSPKMLKSLRCKDLA